LGLVPDGSISELAGFLGVLVYLGGYLALQLGVLGGQTYLYAALNIVAAGCVLVSLRETFNLSSALIQATWIVISVVGIARLALTSLLVRFNPEERALLASKFPGLPKHVARPFLRGGAWVDAPPGTDLTVEGEPVGQLVYLARGAASVRVGRHVVGACGPDSFIGELTCFSGDPASATVRLDAPSRYFGIAAKRLRQLCRRNPELRRALEAGFGEDTRRKLLKSNAAQSDRLERLDAGRAR
jgi:CRP-like cAMP-binding protein